MWRTAEFWATTVGVCAVVMYIFSYQIKRRTPFLIFNVIFRTLYIVQYLLLGAFEGAALDLCGVLISALAVQKNKPWMKRALWVYILVSDLLIVGAGLWLYQNVFSLLPIFGVLLHTTAFWMSKEKNIRAVSLGGSPFWLGYNLYSRAYGSVVGDVLSIVSLGVAILRYDILKKEKPPKKETEK